MRADMQALYRLGNSGLYISKIILGTASYGSSRWQDWVLEEEEALPLLEHAFKAGINTWDTVCLSLKRGSVKTDDFAGRRLLQWAFRRDHCQGSQDIQNSSA
jgi:hypothetical protein